MRRRPSSVDGGQAAVLRDQNRADADRPVLAGRRHQRLDAFAALERRGVGRCAVDGVFDARRGLGVDQRGIVARDEEFHLKAERLGEGVVEFGKPRDRVAGARLGDDAHPERADILAPVGRGRHRQARSPRCTAHHTLAAPMSGTGGRACLPNCQCPWQTLCLTHPSGNRSQYLSNVASVPVRPRFIRRRRSRRCGAFRRRRLKHVRAHRRGLRRRQGRPRRIAARTARPSRHDVAGPWPRGQDSGRLQGRHGRAAQLRLPRRRAGSLLGQGHAVRPLGDRRPAGALRMGLFSKDGSDLSRRADRSDHPRGRAAGHTRRLPCIRHRDHRKARRGAYPDRQADLLHLGRFRHPDRGA